MDRLQAIAARWGWPKTIFRIAVTTAARYLGIHVYVVRTRHIPAEPVYPATNPNLAFRKIETAELLVACADPQIDLDENFVAKALERGDLAFGAFDGAYLVSFIWRSVDSAPDSARVWIRVKKPYNYAYKSFTHPDYRGQRISPVVHLFSDNEVRKLGYRYRAGFVSIANYSSLAMGRKMGSVKIGHAGYLMWFGRLLPFRSRAVKEIGFEFFRPKEPE